MEKIISLSAIVIRLKLYMQRGFALRTWTSLPYHETIPHPYLRALREARQARVGNSEKHSSADRLLLRDLRSRRVQDQFLHAPIQQFADVQLVFRRAGDFVNPPELLELLAGLAQHAHNFSVQREFVDAPRISVRSI